MDIVKPITWSVTRGTQCRFCAAISHLALHGDKVIAFPLVSGKGNKPSMSLPNHKLAVRSLSFSLSSLTLPKLSPLPNRTNATCPKKDLFFQSAETDVVCTPSVTVTCQR